MKNEQGHPDSQFKIIQELNKLVYDRFPPKKDKHGDWLYGKLYFYGDDTFRNNRPGWYLDGMTPVGWPCVLDILKLSPDQDAYFENGLTEHIKSNEPRKPREWWVFQDLGGHIRSLGGETGPPGASFKVREVIE